MNLPNVAGAVAYARQRMGRELSPALTYHDWAHTFERVLPAAVQLARLCNLPLPEQQLITVAAAFHDMGWIITGSEHEQLSADMGREVLPGFGFAAAQIDAIAGMIMATRLPQTPRTLAEAIVADADLDVLGREDFWMRNAALRQETAVRGLLMSDLAWYQLQLQFMRNHHYHTAVQRQQRASAKQQHIEEMERRLWLIQQDGDQFG